MRTKQFIFILILLSPIYLQNTSDTLNVTDDTKAPLIVSSFSIDNHNDRFSKAMIALLPFLNDDPSTMILLSTLLFIAHNTETLDNNYPDPNKALLLSSIPLLNLVSNSEIGYIPSLGQLYNKKPLKAFAMMGMKSYWLSEYHRSSKEENGIKDRNRSLWWLVILILYGMVDAYVDAHLDNNMNQTIDRTENDYNGEKE